VEQYGIKGAELSWFRSYMSKKSQETKFYDKISDAINDQLGVLQGSVLGHCCSYVNRNMVFWNFSMK
jgi:hypothetical protein